MASAAAVAADVARSPLPDGGQNDELQTTGAIISADGAVEGQIPKDSPREDEDDDDDDDDVTRNARRKPAQARDVLEDDDEEDEDVVIPDGDDEDDAGLFGEGTDEDGSIVGAKEPRRLDDEELDSGDDMDRGDRALFEDGEQEEAPPQEEELTFMDVDIGRHAVPNPSDGELYLLKIPQFLSIEPNAFNPETFKVPTTDHHSKEAPSNVFSAFKTAQTTVRWRQSPSDPSKLQSNARILRWSDGSLTLQLATNPRVQYAIQPSALAPPQQSLPKPTPLTGNGGKKYNAREDTFTYLAAPNERAQVLRFTNKLTTSLHVQGTKETEAETIQRLAEQIKAQNGGGAGGEGRGINMIQITEDPELAKRKAEQAEREKMKAQRKRELQERKEQERMGRVMNRRVGGGLTVGALEDEELGGPGVGRRVGRARPKPKRRTNRRGEILSDDEEDYSRPGRTREDEYDEEDDFIVGSDEEEEVVEDNDDSDDGIVEEPRRGARATAPTEREGTPKRDRDSIGEGQQGSPVARSKRRRIIEEDEDD